MSMSDAQIEAELDRIRMMPWQVVFHKTLDNPGAPGGKVDMYLLIDDDTGEGIVGLSVPHGQSWIADYVASCCANPYFVRYRETGSSDIKLAVAFNQKIREIACDADGLVDSRAVHVAAISALTAYIEHMGRGARNELIDKTISVLTKMRAAP